MLAAADRAYANGDWQTAAARYAQLRMLTGIPQAEAERAWLGQIRALLADGQAEQALEQARQLAASPAESTASAEAQLYVAESLAEIGDLLAASEAYGSLAQRLPVVASYAREWQGDAAFASQAYAAALEAYQASLQDDLSVSRQAGLLEKTGLTYAAMGLYPESMQAYDQILSIAQNAGYRARIMYQAADTALLFGDTAEGYGRFQLLTQTYPQQPYAYEALIKLVDANEPVDDLLRGLIDYYAEAYSPAVLALYRVIQEDPNHDGEPHYYIAMSYLESGSYALAIDEFETLINTHPSDAYWGSAWIGQGQALAAMGRTGAALNAYRTLIDRMPDHPRAPEALTRAAELLISLTDLESAAETFIEMAESYPDDGDAPKARFRAGLLLYRAGNLEDARAAWQDLLVWYPYDDYAMAARFWTGKAHLQAGETLSATQLLSETAGLQPWSFYGLRAADLLASREPFARTGPAPNPCGSVEEQAAAEAWLAGQLGLTTSAGLAELPAELRQDERLLRGEQLLRLGRFDAGRAELEALREATASDALTQYRLALYFRDIGLYRSSIIAASSVSRIVAAGEFAALPRFIGCLIYPTYYSDLVEEEARREDLDPLFVYALLRQESLFEGTATSYAAAHGLMQVIPPTGAQIAEALGWPPGYETEDLYRPMVSVRFGVWYLAQQRDRMEGNLFAAMASYNGGPGNASTWWDTAGADQDLFVETIGFAETRLYVERIREYYARYIWLYRDAPSP